MLSHLLNKAWWYDILSKAVKMFSKCFVGKNSKATKKWQKMLS